MWPALVFATVLVLGRYVVPVIVGDAEMFEIPLGIIAVFAGLSAALGIVLWWLFFSRAPWSERVGAILLAAAAVYAMRFLIDESIRGGMMGNMLYVYSIPVLCLALAVWAAATRRLADGARRAWLVAAIILACVPFTALRTAGITGGGAEWHWRWTPTPEEELLARARNEPEPVPPSPAPPPPAPAEAAKSPAPEATPAEKPAAPAKPAASSSPAAKSQPAVATSEPAPATTESAPEWPGFRGPERDGIVHRVRIKTDWSQTPPVELWRRPIGPGWSSFAVHGDLLYTQEQRGEEEMVTCYKVSTGEPVWRHTDPVRFWESNGGAGPRGTPTLSDGRVYAFGATGILNALDAKTGKRVWSRNVAAETEVETPGWGFASSPLVVDDVVIVAASGRLAGYDAATGKPRWLGPTGGGGYSSPHLMTIGGVDQVVLARGGRTTSVAPADGTVLWEHKGDPAVSIVQPAVAGDGEVLIGPGDMMGGIGIRRFAVTHGPAGWKVEDRWTSRGLKPYFNDFVVHKGHAYGFDGSILASIDLEDGSRKWKGGRYGSGQLVLLAEQDLLLVVSEEGELALVSATPDQFREVTRFHALNAKTWNHPVVVGDLLLVRNGEEMAAFRLPRADSGT